MSTIQELREITQSEKIEGRERPWGYQTFQRGPSIFITKALLKTRVTPNQITLLSIMIGLVGCFLIYWLPFGYKVVGILFLYINIILDKVDGEVARYKKIFSLRGIYLDEINHLVVPPLFFFALTFGIFPNIIFVDTIIFLFGGLAALSMPIIRIGHSLAPQIYAKKYLKRPELFTLTPVSGQTTVDKAKESHRIARTFLSVMHQFQEFFMILAIFTITLIWEHLFRADFFFYPATTWTLVIYGILLPLLVLENIVKGYLSVEKRISIIASRFGG